MERNGHDLYWDIIPAFPGAAEEIFEMPRNVP
jgi:hypothetical protein